MNYVDLLLVAIVAVSAYSGWKTGFILSFTELINWTGSLLIGFLIYPYLSALALKILELRSFWSSPIIFLICIVIGRIILGYILNSFLGTVPESAHHRPINKALGVLPGFINGLIFAALVAIVISGVPLGNSFSEETQNSSIAYKLTTRTRWIENKVRPVFSDMLKESGTAITIHPETNKLIKLPFKIDLAKPRPDLEAQMLVLINQERAENKLKPLKADPLLREVARHHSDDMLRRGYFSHQSPEGSDPFDRIRKASVPFNSAGENLALSPNLKTAHDGLMESPGHRANILHKDFGRVGIGILDGGSNGIMVTQNFRN